MTLKKNKKQLKEDLDNFFQVAMSSVCKCYDHTKGFYPDSCGCEGREKISKAIQLLIKEHKELLKKYDLL